MPLLISAPFWRIVARVVITSIGLHGLTFAETEDPLPTVVVIGATPLPGMGLEPDQLAAPVQRVTGEDLDRSHALDLSDHLNRSAGSVHVNSIQGNGLQPDLSYRGYTASPLLGTPQGLSIYVDGVRINQPFGDVVSWDLIPRAAISSMALMPGSNPVFGLNTLGGALSITTRDGQHSPGSSIQAVVGKYGRRIFEFEHGGYNDQGLHWFLTGNVYSEEGWRDESPSDARQLFGKLGWRNSATDLALTLSLADNILTGNGLQQKSLLARDWRSIYTKPDETGNTAASLALALNHAFNDSLLLSGNAYYRRIHSDTYNGDINEDALDQSPYQPGAAERAALSAAGYSEFPVSGASAANTPFPFWRCLGNVLLQDEPAEQCNGLINRSRTEQENFGLAVQLSLQGQLLARPNRLAVGAAYDTNRVGFRQTAQFGYLTPDRGVSPVDFFADGSALDDVGSPIDSRVQLNSHTRSWSMYAVDTLTLDDHWHLTLSGRYNRTSVRNRDGLSPGGGSGSLDGNHQFSRFNPAIGLTWTPDKSLGAYAGYSEGSRTPTAVELGCADPANPCKLPNAMAGDPPLKQVVVKSWEAGLRGVMATGLRWRVGVFRADNFDDLLFVADNAAGFGYFRNFGRTRRQGLELGVDGQVGGWTLGGNFTRLDATYRNPELVNGAGNSSNGSAMAGFPGQEGNITIRAGDRIPLMPRHMLKLFATWQATPTVNLNIDLIAIGKAYARGNENNQHQPDGMYFLDPGTSPGYAVLNLGVDWQATRTLKWFVQVDNLFDTRYATAAQLGTTGLTAAGSFVARPFPAAANGEWPLRSVAFLAPGAPRMVSLGARYRF
jgi:outer membrane receptor protein involved in Fe transport